MWDIRTNSLWSVQTLLGHSGKIRCLHLERNRLISGSTDLSIKVREEEERRRRKEGGGRKRGGREKDENGEENERRKK